MVKKIPDNFLVIDRSNNPLTDNIIYPFAFDEILCRAVGDKNIAAVHIWRHTKAFVMGQRDSRLPNASRASNWLINQGYDLMVRNSGGAAVPLDYGVVNISITLPITGSIINFSEDFDIMFQLIRETLKKYSLSLEKGEVKGSYCPGSYDLSIEGKKICGIAQRRHLKAFIIQAFLNIEGSGKERAELVQNFYSLAIDKEKESKIPIIIPDKVTSIKEQYKAYNVSLFINDLKNLLLNAGGININTEQIDLTYKNEINDMIKEFRKRYPVQKN